MYAEVISVTIHRIISVEPVASIGRGLGMRMETSAHICLLAIEGRWGRGSGYEMGHLPPLSILMYIRDLSYGFLFFGSVGIHEDIGCIIRLMICS